MVSFRHRWLDRVDRRAAAIAGVCFVIAVAWITGSDWLAARLSGGDAVLYGRLQSIKGLAFVTALAVGLYVAIAWANAREWALALEKRELEEMLVVAQRLEALGTLAGTIVHDFNNIVAVIRTTTSLIQLEGKASPAVAARLDQIDAATEQAIQLVRQLMLFMRNAPLVFEVVDLRDVVRDFLPILERAAGCDVTVQMDVALEGAPARIVRSQVESALLNLVVNARDALADATTKQVRLTLALRPLSGYRSRFRSTPAVGRYVTLAVADTGPGIPRDHQVRVFSPFFTTKQPGHGTGLGLASVMRVMQTHDGWVEVESEPGHGATFTLFFPLASASFQAAPSHAS